VSAQKCPEPGWQIGLSVPAGAAEIFVQALEPLCYATAIFVEDEAANLWRLTAYTVGPPPENELIAAIAIASVCAEIDEPAVKCLLLAESDWVAVSRSAVEPVSAGRYFIRPSYLEESSPRGAIVLTIDASTAFGSGDHGTTRGCLLALDNIAKESRIKHPLDLGCGSGILALAMARTWRRPVVASDIDEEAIRVTNENARINDVADLVKTHCSAGFNVAVTAEGPYDLVVANILLGPLVNMADDIACHLTTGGIAIMSGILGYQEKDLRPAYVAAGLQFISRFELDGWHTLVLSKT
jgi:ribosomal protein L11 methyltransferase